MNREELERLTKPELIDLLLGLQRPDKTSRTSSKPPSTDRKAKREGSRPGGAKLGHKGVQIVALIKGIDEAAAQALVAQIPWPEHPNSENLREHDLELGSKAVSLSHVTSKYDGMNASNDSEYTPASVPVSVDDETGDLVFNVGMDATSDSVLETEQPYDLPRNEIFDAISSDNTTLTEPVVARKMSV